MSRRGIRVSPDRQQVDVRLSASRLETQTDQFPAAVAPSQRGQPVYPVRPGLVVEVRLLEWTALGRDRALFFAPGDHFHGPRQGGRTSSGLISLSAPTKARGPRGHMVAIHGIS